MDASSEKHAPRGEAWVWFTGLGLIAGLGMVLGLLVLVGVNGVTVFWAPPVPVAQVDDGRLHPLQPLRQPAGRQPLVPVLDDVVEPPSGRVRFARRQFPGQFEIGRAHV